MLLLRALALTFAAKVFIVSRVRASALTNTANSMNYEDDKNIKYEDWYKWLTNNNSNYYDQYKPAEVIEGDFNDVQEPGFHKMLMNSIFPEYSTSEDDNTAQKFDAAARRNPADITAWLQGLAENGYEPLRPQQSLDKRSALRAALQAGPAGRRRRDPQSQASALPARDTLLGDSYPLEHGSLNNIEHYFGALHGSLHSLSAFPPGHRPGPPPFGQRPALDSAESFYEDTPNGMLPPLAAARTAPRRPAPPAFLHSLRPERSFDRRSGAGSERHVGYRGANFHDPKLLWIGLGR